MSTLDPRPRTVATLGPPGTDAHHEALRLGFTVTLCGTFGEAMERALREDCAALVASGYLDVRDGTVAESWVDLHFRHTGRLRVDSVWESPTKPMCLAVTRGMSGRPIRSLALHPSTREIAAGLVADEVTRHFVNAKPKAVDALRSGMVDAALCSLDTAQSFEDCEVVRTVEPTMIWCLYIPESPSGISRCQSPLERTAQ